MASLLLEVIFSQKKNRTFRLHAFAIMPDHLHLLLTPETDQSIERCMQFIKGGFSFRAKKDLQFTREVWTPGFNKTLVLSPQSFVAVKEYIENNPVKAGMSSSAEDFQFCSVAWRNQMDEMPDFTGAKAHF